MFVHRTAVMYASGEVPTCSAPFAAIAGRFDREGRYESQRAAFDSGASRYDIRRPDGLTREAWDFERYRQ